VTRGGDAGLPVAGWVALWLGAWVGVAVAANLVLHGVVNPFHTALALFLAINVMICVWEICLLLRIDQIEERHRLRGSAGPRPGGGRSRSFFVSRVSWRELGSAALWSRVWSEYATYDASYADRRSFGFAIDVGNGVSTLLPSLIFAVGMTLPILSPAVLGIIGLLVFWQKLYGTCLYFFTYVFNRRYQGQPLARVLVFVGGVNGIWLLFPALGLYVCGRLILDGRFDVLWS
jgi:hypothetical protein